MADDFSKTPDFVPTTVEHQTTPREMRMQLEAARDHVSAANDWAQENFRRFPHLSTVSVNLGASFFITFDITLTFSRPPEQRRV